MKKIYLCIFVLMLSILIILTGCAKKDVLNDDNKFKVVTSFYPLYIMALNITDGIDDVIVNNMASTNIGCLHNYALQASDMKTLANADMFIMNGFGIETFGDKIKQEYPSIEQIDTSTVELELIKDSEGINGHIWNSLNNYIEQIQVILNSLCAEKPENTNKFTENANKYIEKINSLKQSMYVAKEGTTVVSCNEALAYILKEAGVSTIEVYSDHEQSALSSEQLKQVIDEVKEKNVKTIFIEKNDNRKIAEIIAKETNAKIYELDANLSGETTKDAYIIAMKNNYNILRNSLE